MSRRYSSLCPDNRGTVVALGAPCHNRPSHNFGKGGPAEGTMPRTGAEWLRDLAAASLAITAAATLDERLAVITERAVAIIGAHLAVTSLTRGPDGSQAVNATSRSDKYAASRDDTV